MTEVLHRNSPPSLPKSLILDNHAFYQRDTDKPVPIHTVHRLIDKEKYELIALNQAYDRRNIKYAQSILERVAREEPVAHSRYQNRIKLNQLAHPVQHYLALQEDGEPIPEGLASDIEAIYGQGCNQLEFLLSQSYLHSHSGRNAQTFRSIEGDLSELSIFLLAARNLTDEPTHPYLLVPSTEDEDEAHLSVDGLHQGFDFTAIRKRDGVHIPLQVKTRTTHIAKYADHIMVISVSDLVQENNATPRQLAEALFFEISSAQHCDTALIDAAEQRLFDALDNY